MFSIQKMYIFLREFIFVLHMVPERRELSSLYSIHWLASL